MFTGSEINPGDAVVGLREHGLRSNGLSLVRKIFDATNGPNWHEVNFQGESLAQIALKPSTIYSKAVVNMFGGVNDEPKAELHGVAHITGGGIPSKLGRILKPSGFGAELFDLFEPSEIFNYCQEHGQITDIEAYRTWNMGQGMFIITPEPETVISIARSFEIEAKVVGKITQNKGIKILSKGFHAKKDKILEF
jgi:phosphoribosylformylglycinamidine cyclo-ligase